MKVLTTEAPGTPEWLAAHQGKLGAHDIASIIRVGRQSPLKVWAKLTQKIPVEDISGKSYIRRGIALEPVVAQLFADATKRTILPSPGLVQHPTLDWIATTPDRLMVAEGKPNGVLECKTAGFGHHREWQSQVPLMVQVQVAMQLSCVEMPMGSAACMPVDADDDTPDVLWADLNYDADLVERILGALVQFREKHWLTDIPPEVTDKDVDTLRKMFPTSISGKHAPLTPDIEALWEAREAHLAEIKAHTTQADEMKAQIQLAMGESEFLVGSTYCLRWRNEPKAEYWVKASSTRVLRRVKSIS